MCVRRRTGEVKDGYCDKTCGICGTSPNPPLTASTTTATSDVPTSSRFTFVHDGHCAGGWLYNPRVANIEGCADKCEDETARGCGFFAFSSSGTCALYSLAGNCPDDDRYADYNAYELIRATTSTSDGPTSSRFTFVHDGHCAGGWLYNPRVANIEDCAGKCEDV